MRRRLARPVRHEKCPCRYCENSATSMGFCSAHWPMVPGAFKAALIGTDQLARRQAIRLAADHIAIEEGFCGED